MMKFAELLPLEAVLPHFYARDKKQALKALAVHAAHHSPLSEREIYATLQQREQVGCTGMGHGVCVPHGRYDGIDHPYVFFARLDQPLDFDAPDARPVDLIFLLLSPSEANMEHVKALAVISKLLRDKALCDAIRTAQDAQAIHRLLLAGAGEAA